MSQPLQIQLSDVKEWVSNETAPLMEPLKDKASNLLKEVKERIDDTTQSGQRILENSEGEMNKNNPKTYRFARNANKFAENLANAVKAVTISDNYDYERLQAFCGELEKTCIFLEQLRRGAYPYISPYFIFDRRRLDVSLKRLYDITKELRNFLTTKYAKIQAIENVDSHADRLLQTLNEIKQNQENTRRKEEREEIIEKQIAENQQKIAEIRAKAELSELVNINQKAGEFKEKVKHDLRYLQKPFLKLQSRAKSGEVAIPLDEMNKLGDYLNDPFSALATEENGYPMLKGLLRKLDATIAEGKLKLKSTRLRKAQDQINSLLNKDTLSQLQNNCKETLYMRKQLLASETITTLQNQLAQIQNKLKDLQKERELISSGRMSLENEQGKLKEKIEIFRKELEKSIFQATNKNVQVALSTLN